VLRLYTFVLWLFLPVLLVRLGLRGLRNRAYWKRIPERFGFGHADIGADVWIHAVSMGEVNAAAPLAEALAEQSPDLRLLVTTMTPTGSEQVRHAMAEDVRHVYMPYDYPFAVGRFLDRVRPRIAIVMETEIWPNVIDVCRHRGIPLAIVNLRLSERSWRGYRRFAPLVRDTLRKVDGFGAQSARDVERLIDLGAPAERIRVTGSIKFEIRQPASLREIAEFTRRQFGPDRRVWVAGSTHEPEEEIILSAFGTIRKRLPDTLLVLVPRHPERFDTVTRLARREGFHVVRRSETKQSLDDDIDVYIGDTMGELPVLYGAADVAFTGGSLVPVGGHNILEACALGVPVVFGPHMFNFQEVSDITLERRAGIQVRDEQELVDVTIRLLEDASFRSTIGDNGIHMIEENRGALARTLAVLPPLPGG
jgi:3-deoxy-D-manno-octulosonic-acid transferase